MKAVKYSVKYNIQKINYESVMDNKLLEILACPICKSPLIYDKRAQELICKADRLAFPVRDDIPVMLEDDARSLTSEEVALLK